MSQPSPALRTRVKFCGITRPEDAWYAVELGVDYLGFVLVPESGRAIDPADAQRIALQVGRRVTTVALLQNAAAAEVHAALRIFKPDLLQFHGQETQAFCTGFGLPWIKALPMGETLVYGELERSFAGAKALLADSHGSSTGGGSGHAFDWSMLPKPDERRLPLMLAGGLGPENVGAAIRQVRPWAVDVSSGIEDGTRGVKDHRKMRVFVEAVRAADEA